MYINKKEYGKLKNKSKEENNMESWNIRENLKVHPIINKIFSYHGDFHDFAGDIDFMKKKRIQNLPKGRKEF